MELPNRKPLRLHDFDYSQNGSYFITICAYEKSPIFGKLVGADDPVRPFQVRFTEVGQIVADTWQQMDHVWAGVTAEQFVVMPNHFHGVLRIDGAEAGGQGRPPLQKLVQGFKSVTTRRCFPLGYRQIWQRSFHDHVIRNEADYLRILQYIDQNPARWAEDTYYKENQP